MKKRIIIVVLVSTFLIMGVFFSLLNYKRAKHVSFHPLYIVSVQSYMTIKNMKKRSFEDVKDFIETRHKYLQLTGSSFENMRVFVYELDNDSSLNYLYWFDTKDFFEIQKRKLDVTNLEWKNGAGL